jgi:hypothetical protein
LLPTVCRTCQTAELLFELLLETGALCVQRIGSFFRQSTLRVFPAASIARQVSSQGLALEIQ